MDEKEVKKIVDSLSGPARERFYELSEIDRIKFLKKVERVTKKFESRSYEKKLDMKKRARKSKGVRNKSLHSFSSSNIKDGISDIRDSYVVVIQYLLATGKVEDEDDRDINEESYSRMESMLNNSIDFKRASSGGTVINYYRKRRNKRIRAGCVGGSPAQMSKSEISKSLVKRDVKRNAAKASQEMQKSSSKLSLDATKSFTKKTKEAAKQLVKAMRTMSNPILLVVGLVIVVFSALFVSIAAVIGSASGVAGDGDSSSYEAKVSEKTESYRTLVEEYCEKYDIADYVELVLAMIEQESGGNPPDVMQTAQSYYNTNPPIDTAEESIDCGTHELSDCLKAAKCQGPNDIESIKLAIQGYNFGNGYIAWALKNYKGYTEESAKVFSAKMKAKLGLSGYGDVDYVKHVLRYYVPVSDTSISNEDAAKILKELKENNKADKNAWKVIERGASLVGKVEYSMDKRQGDGRDNPEYLDCSSFTAWAFHKSGYSGVPYASTTATFISSVQYETISADKLKPGDIGLKSSTAETGGANHVGIYCGKLKNGTKVWLHCTSSSSTSLTGNTSGVMFGAYTNFAYFRHFKKFD